MRMTAVLDTQWALRWVQETARVVAENRALLIDLDRVIGDADHGENLDRGFSAAVAKLDAGDAPATPAAVLKQVAMTLMSTVGGAAGPLYGTAFLRAATSLGDVGEIDAAAAAGMIRAARDGIVARGKAEVGDKTMVDAIVPFAARFREELDRGSAPGDALAAAASAATEAAAATSDLMPRMGRARPHAEKSLGSPDPGAHSFALIVTAIADALPTVAAQPEQGTS
jgi:dihydroxyacetone kinase-like protein